MKTLHKTAKDISNQSLFVRGGTLGIEQIKANVNILIVRVCIIERYCKRPK